MFMSRSTRSINLLLTLRSRATSRSSASRLTGSVVANRDSGERLVDVHRVELLAVRREADHVVVDQDLRDPIANPALPDLDRSKDAVVAEHERRCAELARDAREC